MKYSNKQTREKAVQAYLKGEKVTDIANILSVGKSTVYEWILSFKTKKSLDRKSNPGSGRPNLFTEKEIKNIIKIIKKPASMFGFDTDIWNIRRIIIVVKKEMNLSISKTTMHRILCDKNQSYKKAESRYYSPFHKILD